MSMFEDMVETVAPNTLVAVGAILLVPVVLPVLKAGLRPLAKGAVKAYLTVEGKVKEFAATTAEDWSDVVAEARAEHAGAAGTAAAASKAASAKTMKEEKPQSSAGKKTT